MTNEPWVQCEEHEGTHRLTDKCVGAVYDAPPGSPEWAEGYRQGFAAGMAYASEIAYEIPEPAVASEPIPIATATPPIIDTATGLAIPVCTCVRGPSSVVPSQSCPVHGWTPEPRHA